MSELIVIVCAATEAADDKKLRIIAIFFIKNTDKGNVHTLHIDKNAQGRSGYKKDLGILVEVVNLAQKRQFIFVLFSPSPTPRHPPALRHRLECFRLRPKDDL